MSSRSGHRQSGSATVLPPDLVERVRRIPGVAAVDTYRATPIREGDRLAFAVGIDFAVQQRFGGLAFLSGESGQAVLGRALARDQVVVTESYAHRRHVHRGRHDPPARAGRSDTRAGRGRLLRLQLPTRAR